MDTDIFSSFCAAWCESIYIRACAHMLMGHMHACPWANFELTSSDWANDCNRPSHILEILKLSLRACLKWIRSAGGYPLWILADADRGSY